MGKGNQGHNAAKPGSGQVGFQKVTLGKQGITERPEISALYENPATAPATDIEAIFQNYSSQEPVENFDEVDEEDLKDDLGKIDKLGLDAANLIMHYRDLELSQRSSFSYTGIKRADQLKERQRALHLAVLQAREELRQAKAHLEGEYVSPALAGLTSVIDSDQLSYEATKLSYLIDDKVESGDLPEARVVKANKHVEEARRLVKKALRAAKEELPPIF